MARIRTIKPEIWSDEKFGPLDPLAKLVYIGLISQADDAGRVLDSVRLIDGTLFPYSDSATCRRSLDDLSSARLIARGTTRGGQPVIQILGWASHQKIDKPNLKACLPEIVSNGARSEQFDDTSAKDRRHVDDASALHTNDHVPRPTTNDRNAHARDRVAEDFHELYQIGHSGPLLTAETAYYQTREEHPGATADIIARRWAAYIARQKSAGLNVPHLGNWLRRGGWADESLDLDPASEPDEMAAVIAKMEREELEASA